MGTTTRLFTTTILTIGLLTIASADLAFAKNGGRTQPAPSPTPTPTPTPTPAPQPIGLTNTASSSTVALSTKDPAISRNMVIRDMHGSIPLTSAPYNIMGLYKICRDMIPGTGQLTAAGAVIQSQTSSNGYTTYKASQSWTCASGPYKGWLNTFNVTYPNYALYRGDIATGEACLTEPAPAGGIVVQIKSVYGRTAPPTSIVIAAGSLCGKFTFSSAGTAGTEYLTVTVNGFSKYAIFDAYP